MDLLVSDGGYVKLSLISIFHLSFWFSVMIFFIYIDFTHLAFSNTATNDVAN